MKRLHLLAFALSTVLFSPFPVYAQGQYPSGRRLPGYILRPQRTPMPGYDCGSEFYTQTKSEETREVACSKLKKKSWFSKILKKYPKKYNPKQGEEFDVSSGDYYIYPLLRNKVYNSHFSRFKGDTFLVFTNDCETAAVIKKEKCESSVCKKNPDYRHCEPLSLVPTYPIG